MANAQRYSEGVEVFFSYSHSDEELRNELEKHLSTLKRLGMISTWHDRKIDAGNDWRGAIDEHLNSAQIILLLISADFLSSDYCTDIEMDRAMKRHELGDATVIPIILRPVDWNGARFTELQALPTNAEPVTSKKWGSHDDAFYDIAKGIRKEIEKQKSMPISQKSGPRTIVVDQMHRGDYPSIGLAIDAANPGDCIKIRHGLYQESIIINKPLEIIGEGERDEIEIRAKDSNAIKFVADYGKVANLTIRQMSQGDFSCVDIWHGRLLIEECDISSQGNAGVVIHKEADPRLRKNQISDNRGFGVIITGEGLGLLEGNQLFRNETSILIEENSKPTIRRNSVKLNRTDGILINETSQCLIEENDVSNNAKIGIEIRSGSNPTLCRNKIHDNNGNGVYISTSIGILEENDIFENNVGVNIDAGGDPILRKIISTIMKEMAYTSAPVQEHLRKTIFFRTT